MDIYIFKASANLLIIANNKPNSLLIIAKNLPNLLKVLLKVVEKPIKGYTFLYSYYKCKKFGFNIGGGNSILTKRFPIDRFFIKHYNIAL